MSILPPDLVTGNIVVDDQHEDILMEVQAIEDLLTSSDKLTQKAGVELIEFLRRHFVAHFGAEEELMAEVTYPDIEVHRAEHIKFFDTFVMYRARVEANIVSNQAVRELLEVVSDWVKKHVKGEDARFAQYYREAKPLAPRATDDDD